MKTLRKNGPKLAGTLALVTFAVAVIYAALTVSGQTGPGLAIGVTGGNQVSLTITNGTNTGLYQIYFAETISSNSDWTLFTNGATGQTNFSADASEFESGFFKAVNNTNGGSISNLTVIIQAPTNGALIY